MKGARRVVGFRSLGDSYSRHNLWGIYTLAPTILRAKGQSTPQELRLKWDNDREGTYLASGWPRFEFWHSICRPNPSRSDLWIQSHELAQNTTWYGPKLSHLKNESKPSELQATPVLRSGWVHCVEVIHTTPSSLQARLDSEASVLFFWWASQPRIRWLTISKSKWRNQPQNPTPLAESYSKSLILDTCLCISFLAYFYTVDRTLEIPYWKGEHGMDIKE